MTLAEKVSDWNVYAQEPLNAGPSLDALGANDITPESRFYIRNHGTIPTVDPDHFRLSITGLVEKSVMLTLDEIQKRFPRQTLTATLQCAGNRRKELHEVAAIPGEIYWDASAIGNAVWGGVPLRDILLSAGIDHNAKHVAFGGADTILQGDRPFGFGGSIPIEKALSSEVLVAYEMNGLPLSPVHGYPLRFVVPGYIGARSVKWLSTITVQASPSTNYFQAHAYKLFPPQTRSETADWSQGLMLGESSVNAAICRPANGASIGQPEVLVQGYAVAGGSRHVERVDVSVDGGETWIVADFLGSADRLWTWRLWEAHVHLPPGPHQLVARAWDSAANTQPEDGRHIWNFKGYMNNAWHRVHVRVVG